MIWTPIQETMYQTLRARWKHENAIERARVRKGREDAFLAEVMPHIS